MAQRISVKALKPKWAELINWRQFIPTGLAADDVEYAIDGAGVDQVKCLVHALLPTITSTQPILPSPPPTLGLEMVEKLIEAMSSLDQEVPMSKNRRLKASDCWSRSRALGKLPTKPCSLGWVVPLPTCPHQYLSHLTCLRAVVALCAHLKFANTLSWNPSLPKYVGGWLQNVFDNKSHQFNQGRIWSNNMFVCRAAKLSFWKAPVNYGQLFLSERDKVHTKLNLQSESVHRSVNVDYCSHSSSCFNVRIFKPPFIQYKVK